MQKRSTIVAGNWKMNMNSASSVALAAGLAKELENVDTVDVAVCPPFVYLPTVAAEIAGSAIKLSAQNMCDQDVGAYTGEISCEMLKDVGVSVVLVGVLIGPPPRGRSLRPAPAGAIAPGRGVGASGKRPG